MTPADLLTQISDVRAALFRAVDRVKAAHPDAATVDLQPIADALASLKAEIEAIEPEPLPEPEPGPVS